jgi:hypothetical protein
MAIKCEKCDTILEIGMYPFCKGTPESHGKSSISKTAIFPYTVNHVDGKPMVIESMQHLRKVEKDFGVVFSAFSHSSASNVDPVDRNLPRFRGDDEDTRRNYRKRYER